MIVNMGPHPPSKNDVFRLIVILDAKILLAINLYGSFTKNIKK